MCGTWTSKSPVKLAMHAAVRTSIFETRAWSFVVSKIVPLLAACLGWVGSVRAYNFPGFPEDTMEPNHLYQVRLDHKSPHPLYLCMQSEPAANPYVQDFHRVVSLWLVDSDRHHILQRLPVPHDSDAAQVDIGDFNFDGYLDVRVFDGMSGKGCRMFGHYLFNPRSGRYESSDVLDKLCGPHFDHQEKTVRSVSSAGGELYTITAYRWIGGALSLAWKVRHDRGADGKYFVEYTSRDKSGKLHKKVSANP